VCVARVVVRQADTIIIIACLTDTDQVRDIIIAGMRYLTRNWSGGSQSFAAVTQHSVQILWHIYIFFDENTKGFRIYGIYPVIELLFVSMNSILRLVSLSCLPIHGFGRFFNGKQRGWKSSYLQHWYAITGPYSYKILCTACRRKGKII
jgi:hypothetical protein